MADFEYLTVEQVAEELGVTRPIVVEMARSGTLPALRNRGLPLRFERLMFERWIGEQYAETRRWVLEHQGRGTHPPWRADWKSV